MENSYCKKVFQDSRAKEKALVNLSMGVWYTSPGDPNTWKMCGSFPEALRDWPGEICNRNTKTSLNETWMEATVCESIRRNNKARVKRTSCIGKARTPLTAIKPVNGEDRAVCTKTRRLWNGHGRDDSSVEDSCCNRGQKEGKEVVVQQYSHCSPAGSSRMIDCNYSSQNDETKTRGGNLANYSE